jgi:hypothetical protein
MTSNTNPFNPDAKIEIDVPADGESFQDWMDKTPFDPMRFATSLLDAEQRAHGLEWLKILRRTAADLDAGVIKRDEFINERNIASAAHRLGHFAYAQMGVEKLMAIAEDTKDPHRQELFLKLILALEERQKYTHRSF